MNSTQVDRAEVGKAVANIISQLGVSEALLQWGFESRSNWPGPGIHIQEVGGQNHIDLSEPPAKGHCLMQRKGTS